MSAQQSSVRVLITGAGSGLGRALALRYARQGARVACVDRDHERAEETVSLLEGSGHLALHADVSDDASMQALQQRVLAEWGGLDLLFNNAGIASGGAMAATSMDEWRQVLDINLLGVVRGCLLFLPAMLKQGRGKIVNTASFAGLASAPNMMTYGVSKAAVVALSEQLRAEVLDQGVQVSVICPAFFQTNLLQSWQGDARMRKFGERMMGNAIDTLDEVADKVVAAVAAGTFLILPTRQEPMRWRLKRWLPGVYFRVLRKMAQKLAAAG